MARGIPYRRLTDGSMVQFGWGAAAPHPGRRDRPHQCHRRVDRPGQGTDQDIAHAAGVPVPDGRPVEDAEDAWAAACEIGVPVVVKPQDGNQGRGVAVNLTTHEQVVAAYESARAEGSSILVEKFAPGCDHRLLVIGERLVAAGARTAARRRRRQALRSSNWSSA